MRLLVLLCSSLLCLAQDSEGGVISEHMQVSLKKVVVRVLDQNGEPVQGLTSADFVLRNHLQKTPITAFEAYSATKPEASQPDVQVTQSQVHDPGQPMPVAKKYLSLLFDTSMMTEDGFEKSKLALIDYIQDKVQEGTTVNLAHLDMNYQVASSFSDDKDALLSAIDDIQHRGYLRRHLHRIQVEINEGYEGLMRNRLGSHSDVPALTKRKGYLKNNHFLAYMHGIRVMGQALDSLEGDRKIMVVSGGSYPNAATKEVFDDLTANLTDKGVSINSLIVRERELGGGSTTVIAHESKTNYSVMDRGGLRYTNSESEHAVHALAGPEDSSERTGGISHQTAQIDALESAFDELDYLANNYYVLWYQSSKPSQKVAIDVPSAGKKWRVIYGKSSKRETPYKDLNEKERAVHFFATLQYGADSNQYDFPARWDYQAYRDGDQIHYAVGANLESQLLSGSDYELAIALLDENREILAMTHRTVSLPQRDFAFYEQLSGDDKARFLSCTARHLDTGKLTQKVFELTEPPLDEPFLSRIALVAERAALGGQFLGDGESPFKIKDQMLPVTFAESYAQGASLGAFVRLQQANAKDGWKVSAILEGDDLKRAARLLVSDLAEDQSAFYFRLDTATMDAGRYRLSLTFMGPDDRVLKRERHFEILQKAF